MTAPNVPRSMVDVTHLNGRLVSVEEERLEEAILKLVQSRGHTGRAQARRFLSFAQDQGLKLDKVWAYEDHSGQYHLTVVAIENPGRTAVVFSSLPHSRVETERLGLLLDHASEDMRGGSVDLLQVLVEPSESLLQEGFELGGFQLLAKLSYMERSLKNRALPPEPQWPDDVSVVAYESASHRAELCGILDATYTETLDCPELRGLRSTSDILDGHQGTGSFDPKLWTILRVKDEPVGAMLLNRAPASHSVELVYIGLAPNVRGRGLGRKLLQRGIHLLAAHHERTLTLAVDEQNTPAIGLYRSMGFRTVLRRHALIRSVNASKEAL